jgi:thymidylate synthase (FAD)
MSRLSAQWLGTNNARIVLSRVGNPVGIKSMRQMAIEDQPSQETNIDDFIGKEIKVLDHGFVRLVDYMGSDSAIVQAARVSYGKGTKKLSEDRGLIRYLMRHRHTTPFEMCEIKFHVKLPIFVARQWVRHRTANINEYSARYSILDKEFYVPDRAYLEKLQQESEERDRQTRAQSEGQDDLFEISKGANKQLKTVGRQSETNKQGRDLDISEIEAADHLKTIEGISSRTYKDYERLLNETAAGDKLNPNYSGIARELARIVLPTNYYSQWYWKIDLHNLLHFLSLRADAHAQHEIREYAYAIEQIVARWVPLTWEAFEDYRLNSVSLSRLEVGLIAKLLKGEECSFAASGLSKREWKELSKKLDLNLPDP